jgi:hypothetical protein
MMNTPRRGYAQKIMASNSLQLPESQISSLYLKNTKNSKTPKSSPLTHGFGWGIKGKRTTKGSHEFPPSNPHRENHQERAPKITTKNNREQHNKALRNHAESSIHTKEVHTRSSLPPDHPTLSQNLTMKLSS